MKRSINIVGFLVMSLFLALPSVVPAAETTEPLVLNKEGHRFVKGDVTKITDAVFFIKTTEGTVRNFSLKEFEKERIRNPKVGDLLIMEFDEGNQIIDIDRVTSLEKNTGELHQTVLGDLLGIDSSKKKVTLQVRGRGKRSFPMKDAVATKIAAVKAGTLVLLELDEENGMVNDFDIRR